MSDGSQLDPSLLMGGSEGGSLPGWSSANLGLIDAWKSDPRALWSSFAMIIVSEIGDKTFLIAAILAMRQSRLIVFSGAFASLAVMSVLSAMLGVVLPTLLPKQVTTFFAAILFFVFGAKMLQQGLQMTGEEMEEEWQEAEREIREEEGALEMHDLEQGGQQRQDGAANANGNGHADSPKHKEHSAPKQTEAKFREGARNLCGLCFSPVFAQAFVLTFLGEWGDRSQIATIALAAAHNVTLVSLGTIAGHACCTSLAVICGSWLASKISVRHVTLGGSALFLLFGFIYLYEALTTSPSELITASSTAAQDAVQNAANAAAGGNGLQAPAQPVVGGLGV